MNEKNEDIHSVLSFSSCFLMLLLLLLLLCVRCFFAALCFLYGLPIFSLMHSIFCTAALYLPQLSESKKNKTHTAAATAAVIVVAREKNRSKIKKMENIYERSTCIRNQFSGTLKHNYWSRNWSASLRLSTETSTIRNPQCPCRKVIFPLVPHTSYTAKWCSLSRSLRVYSYPFFFL